MGVGDRLPQRQGGAVWLQHNRRLSGSRIGAVADCRPVRAEVSWCRPGPARVDRRTGGRRIREGAWPASAGDRVCTARLGPGAHRTRPGNSGSDPRQRRPRRQPARQQHRPEPRAGLPARLGDLRSAVVPARCRPGLTHRLVRCLRQQPRPHRAQHQHAGVARQTLAHRPRRRAVFPPRLARLHGARQQPVQLDQRPRAVAVGPPAGRGRRLPRAATHAGADRPRHRRGAPRTRPRNEGVFIDGPSCTESCDCSGARPAFPVDASARFGEPARPRPILNR